MFQFLHMPQEGFELSKDAGFEPTAYAILLLGHYTFIYALYTKLGYSAISRTRT